MTTDGTVSLLVAMMMACLAYRYDYSVQSGPTTPQRWWDENGARFLPCTPGPGGDGSRLSCLALPHPTNVYKLFLM